MKIGELAKQAGVSIDTVRYYEREGVLPIPVRQGSGYRQYEAADLGRLQFVRRAKALGFSLTEITDLLSLSQRSGDDMADVRHTAQARLRDVNHKLEALTRIKHGLDLLVAACPGFGEIKECPIVAALTSTKGALSRSEPPIESIYSATKENSATQCKTLDVASEKQK